MFEIAGGIVLAVVILVVLMGVLSDASNKPGTPQPPASPTYWETREPPDLRSDWQKRKDAAEQAALRR